MATEIYFSDNFFSAGITTIFDDKKEAIGSLDLMSAFTSSLAILDLNGNPICEGKFRTFSNRWVIRENSEEIGELRQRFAFFKKRYEYSSYNNGTVLIESEAFSREYRLISQNGEMIADFRKISGFFQSPSFQLINHSEQFTNAELIAVVMGVHMINKRNDAAATNNSSVH